MSKKESSSLWKWLISKDYCCCDRGKNKPLDYQENWLDLRNYPKFNENSSSTGKTVAKTIFDLDNIEGQIVTEDQEKWDSYRTTGTICEEE